MRHRGRANSDELRRTLERGHATTPGADTTALGYAGPGGVAQPVQGDGEAPFLKAPPFPSDTVAWFTATEATAGFIGDYVFTDPVEVEANRQLTVWIDWRPAIAQGSETALLSIVPLAARVRGDTQPATDFFPLAVIEPAVNALDLSTTVFNLSVFGSQTYRPWELRTPAVPTGEVLQVALSFDVAPFVALRLAVGATRSDPAVTAALNLRYSLSQ